MAQTPDLLALLRLSVIDPTQGGRAVLALRLPTRLRWMLLAAAILVSVVLVYVLPVLSAQAGQMPPPLAFAAGQGALNLLVVALVAYVGRAFGGHGSFDDALLLMAWLQCVTVGFLLLQMLAIVIVPFLTLLVTMASIVVSLWMLTGFICALHGFQSRAMVLVASVMVFTLTAFVLSLLLVLLGVDFSGAGDV